ncbi:2-oxoacid:ferredoxin oxidoreductase subunit beta [Candidatus Bathyarchaeota archaeon RBG_13_60_20]|nr:MAG: 2-oxoacid:ferredoxin oxidoreductase subunit beta [Candidatus Bathyarchaeota archaeon RBG_13_60_20]
MSLTMKDLDTGATNTWCPGCGNFAILMTVKQALIQLGLNPSQVVAVSGIGCHGKTTDYLKVNTFHVIHGRVLPAATAIKLANHGLTVLGFAGDGDAFNIGMGHFPHAARRNVNMAYIVHDNLIYGLTTGQASPTSRQGLVTKTTPRGSAEPGVNPLTQSLTGGATFVARTFAGEAKHMTEVLKRAITHRGFAVVDVLQPCVTFNRVNTYEFYKQRVRKLEEEGHDEGDFEAAYRRAQEWGDVIPIGVFYVEERPTYEDGFPALAGGPLVGQPLSRDLSGLMAEFK